MAQKQLNDPPPVLEGSSFSDQMNELYQFYDHPKKLTLAQGQFLLERRLEELEFRLSENETPRDGSCLFHGLLDQMQKNPDLQDEASSHLELRWKIVNYGCDSFIKTGKLGWIHPETPEDWRKKMSRPDEFGQYEWGDDVALQLATNVLGVDIILVPAFKESAQIRNPGITIIWSREKSKYEPFYLFYYSESDFSSPHFQSIFPRSSDNLLKTYLRQNDDRGSLSLPLSLTHSASAMINLTEESLQDIPIVMDNTSFQSVQVVSENPVWSLSWTLKSLLQPLRLELLVLRRVSPELSLLLNWRMAVASYQVILII